MIDAKGRNAAFEFTNELYFDITSTDYDPLTTGSVGDKAYNEAEKGFYVKPNGTGILYAVTWQDWFDNGKILTGVTPVKLYVTANQPEMVRIVKVIANDDATYTDGTITEVNIGFN